MNLIIGAILSEPPSQISCFRDVTLYGKTFIFDDILVDCPTGTRSLYWRWLKRHGAHDFISQLLREDEKEYGFIINERKGNLRVPFITASNLNHILSILYKLRSS